MHLLLKQTELKPLFLRSSTINSKFFFTFLFDTASILLTAAFLEFWDSLHCFGVMNVFVVSYFSANVDSIILSRAWYGSYQVRSTFIWSYAVYFTAFTLREVLWLVPKLLETLENDRKLNDIFSISGMHWLYNTTSHIYCLWYLKFPCRNTTCSRGTYLSSAEKCIYYWYNFIVLFYFQELHLLGKLEIRPALLVELSENKSLHRLY